MKDIFIFGDSVAYGQWDEQGGWPQRLRSSLDQSYISQRAERTYVYNLGVPGETAADVLKRFGEEVRARTKAGRKNVIIIAVGLNDAHFMVRKNRPMFTAEEFEANLRKLVAMAREHSSQIALVGLNPVDEAKVTPLPWNPEKSYQNERIREFNGIIEKVAKEENLFFADIWESFGQQDYKSLLSDGLHPNASGHRRIAERVVPFVLGTPGVKMVKTR